MNCKRIKNLIPLYASGDLEPDEAKIVKEHIEKCLHCNDEVSKYVELRKISKKISEFGEALPEFDGQKIMRVIKKYIEEQARLRRRVVIMLCSLAACVLLVLSFALVKFAHQEPILKKGGDEVFLEDLYKKSIEEMVLGDDIEVEYINEFYAVIEKETNSYFKEIGYDEEEY